MRPCSSFTIRFSDRLLVFLWSIPDWADMGLGLIYGTVLAAWAMLIMRTALVLFGWSADAITTLLTLLVFVALLRHVGNLDDHSKGSAERVVLSSKGKALTERLRGPPTRITSVILHFPRVIHQSAWRDSSPKFAKRRT